MLCHPIFFVHGLLIYKRAYLKASDWPETAKNCQVELYIHERPAKFTMAQRADHLYEVLNSPEWHGRKVHLLGHSAGGLDIRLMLHKYPKMAGRIVSAGSIESPHRGTPIADDFLSKVESCPFVEALFDKIENADAIAREMTVSYMQGFNDTVKNNPNVKYWSMPFFIRSIWDAPRNYKGWKYLKAQGFPLSDGTVPFKSQLWGEVVGDKSVTVAIEKDKQNQVIKVFKANYGDHESTTFPFRYRWRKISAKVLQRVIWHLRAYEAGVK